MANDYWKKRIETEQLAKMERGATLSEEMDRLYSYHFNELEKEIRAFEQRYADKNGLSLAEVKARVNDFDVKAFEEKARRYVAEKNFSARANSELALYNLKMKTNRLALLQYQLDLELVALADGERQLTDRFLNDEFVKAIETQSGLLGQSVLSASQIKTVAQSVLNTPFEGVVWSERIWQRQNALREVVARMTERLLLQGKNPTTMVAQLRKEFNVTASEAKRLAVTEGARVSTEGQKQAYIANEIDEYEFIAEPSACPNCAKKDGKIFKVKDMIPGENAAPMHPWCHCSTGAHFREDNEYDRLIQESWKSRFDATEQEAESSHKGIDRAKQINKTVINSSSYRRRVDSLGESIDISRAMWNEMRSMLEHRNGTEFEDLVFIDSITGKTMVSNHEKKIRAVSPTKAMLNMLKNTEPGTVIAIHNHPGSSVPSYSDLQAAYNRGYKYGLIACHDGTIFKYSVGNSVDEALYNSLLAKLEKKGYTKDSLKEFSIKMSLIGVELEVI
ncbi:minor capsid protein [Streptococcus suis]|nr:minor capsid protein [Streptococcus suis]